MTQRESKHFTLERLSDSVHAAIHREGGWAISNAGFVDLGNTTVVFDTFLTHEPLLISKWQRKPLPGSESTR